MSTSFPCVLPASPVSCARLASASGKVAATWGRSAPWATSAASDSSPSRSGSTSRPATRDASRRALAQRLGAPGHGDEDAVVAEGRERVVSRVAADEVEHDVHVADARPDRPGRVIDGLVRPERREEGVLLRAGRADDVGTARLRDLHREVPDPARGRENEDAGARPDSCRLDERLPGGETCERERGGLLVEKPIGDPGELT